MYKVKGAFRAFFLTLFTATVTLGGANPPGLEVRLQTHLTSYSSPNGMRFQCVVIRSLEINGQTVIPMGSIVSGHVAKTKSVGLGFLRDRATLELAFDEYSTPDGKTFPLEAKLISIDNALEKVTPKGQIKGVLAASNPNHFIFGVWNRPSVDLFSRALVGLTGASNQIASRMAIGPMGAVAMLGLRCAVFKFPEPEIHLPPGADMTLSINLKVNTPATGEEKTRAAEAPLAPEDRRSPATAAWIQTAPYAIEKRGGQSANDVINVALIGTRQELVDAFAVAGWALADPGTARNYSRMYAAYNAMRVYASAPVSTLLYQGQAPEMVFEKSLDTIAKRHHIRVWHRGVVDGQDIWLGAATHDSGIAFKVRSASFTHKIDTDIDVERTKIATDLVFAGCAEDTGLVERSEFSSVNSENAVATDGAVDVLLLRPCVKAPVLFAAASAPALPGNKASRLTRRIVLEARNYILRENAYYLGYQLARHSLTARSGSISEKALLGK